MEIEYLPINEIKPYEKNAKQHPEEQIAQIKASIEAFGMNDPLAIWSDENLIVEGHGRYFACLELGMNEVPVIRLDALSEEQRKAYTLVHNKLTMATGFDLEALERELQEIGDDLSVYGIAKKVDELSIGDLQDFFDDEEEEDGGSKIKAKKCTCPYCGEVFERD